MPVPSPGETHAHICASSIAALCVLQGRVDKAILPRPPRNVPNAWHQRTQGYETLSFHEEVRLARSMAFLAYLRDDPNCIPAVCIEQGTMVENIGGLCVRVATNTGVKMLEEAVLGLRGICALMARRASSKSLMPDTNSFAKPELDSRKGHESGSASHDDIFLAIIEMCSPRILTRLGLRTRKRVCGGKQKQTFVEALHGARLALTSVTNSANISSPMASEITIFISCTKEIDKRISHWKRHATSASLATVVADVHNLNTRVDVEALLACVPRDVLDKSCTTSISNKIRKIARYFEIARYFGRRAYKDAAFRGIQVLPVILPDSIFSINALIPDTTVPSYTKTFAHVLKHAAPSEDGRKLGEVEFMQLLALLKQTPEKAQHSFQDRLAKLRSSATKVHAEVKLLSFYELLRLEAPTRSFLMPRAVCSSKDACWLCDALITAHGAMFTPRCHGVLYPSWKLPTLLAVASSSLIYASGFAVSCPPTIPPNTQVSARLAVRLHEQVVHSVRTILSLRQRPSYPPPLESTLSMLPCSLSTVHLPLNAVMDAQCGPDTLDHGRRSVVGAAVPTTLPGTHNEAANETSSMMSSSSEDSRSHTNVLYGDAQTSPVLLCPGRPIRYRQMTATSSSGLWLRARGIDLFLESAGSCTCDKLLDTLSPITSFKIQITDRPQQYDGAPLRVHADTSHQPAVGEEMPAGVEYCLEEDERGCIRLELPDGSSVRIRRRETVVAVSSRHLVSNL